MRFLFLSLIRSNSKWDTGTSTSELASMLSPVDRVRRVTFFTYFYVKSGAIGWLACTSADKYV